MALAVLAGILAAPSAKAEGLTHIGTVRVYANDRDGENFHRALRDGYGYTFVATGVYSYGPAGTADAECAREHGFQPSREWYGPNTLDLLIGGHAHEWVPIDGYHGSAESLMPEFARRRAGCSSGYKSPVSYCVVSCPEADPSYRFSAVANAQIVNFRIADDVVEDNSGYLTVDIYEHSAGLAPPNDPVPGELPPFPTLPPKIPPSPLGASDGIYSESFLLSASDPVGVTGSLNFKIGRTYKFVVTGKFAYNSSGGLADAECSTTSSDPLPQRSRFGPYELNLILNGFFVSWQPVEPVGHEGCSASSTYEVTLQAVENGKVSYRLYDSSPQDNRGSLSISVARIS